jgi:hypothetical protein
MTGGITIFIFLFITIFGLLLNFMGLATFTIMSPTVFAVGQVLLMAVILVSNTPVVKGGALVLWAGWLFAYISSLEIPNEIKAWVYPIIIVPCLIGMGYEFMEVGKG